MNIPPPQRPPSPIFDPREDAFAVAVPPPNDDVSAEDSQDVHSNGSPEWFRAPADPLAWDSMEEDDMMGLSDDRLLELPPLRIGESGSSRSMASMESSMTEGRHATKKRRRRDTTSGFPLRDLPVPILKATVSPFLTPPELAELSRVSRRFSSLNLTARSSRYVIASTSSLEELLRNAGPGGADTRQLTSLQVFCGGVTAAHLLEIREKFPNLQSFQFEWNDGAGPESLLPLLDLPNLRTLALNLKSGGDLLADAISRGLPQLDRLVLNNCALTDTGAKALQGLQLKHLDLGFNGALTDAGLAWLSQSTQLEELHVPYTGATSACLAPLRPEHLKYVNLCGRSVPDLTPFQAFAALEKLNLGDTRNLVPEQLSKVAGLPNLDTLILRGDGFDEQQISFFRDSTLKTLVVSSISNEGVRWLPKGLLELECSDLEPLVGLPALDELTFDGGVHLDTIANLPTSLAYLHIIDEDNLHLDLSRVGDLADPKNLRNYAYAMRHPHDMEAQARIAGLKIDGVGHFGRLQNLVNLELDLDEDLDENVMLILKTLLPHAKID
ncbi:hypothetical protein [Ramlibacter sp.]|uniref:hypothetical protein n=1 Tax=Ramlibacter sp. TaxID=1917967 RepID=UPI003D107D38